MGVKDLKDNLEFIDDTTKYWDSYPMDRNHRFGTIGRPQAVLASFIDEAYGPAQRLSRNASSTRLGFTNNYDYTSERRPNHSALSPSHGLSFTDRVPERYLPSSTMYKTKSFEWYNERAAPFRSRSVAYTSPVQRPEVFDAQVARDDMTGMLKRTAWTTNHPSDLTRWEYAQLYDQGRWQGVRAGTPFLVDDGRESRRYNYWIRGSCRNYNTRYTPVDSHGNMYPTRSSRCTFLYTPSTFHAF